MIRVFAILFTVIWVFLWSFFYFAEGRGGGESIRVVDGYIIVAFKQNFFRATLVVMRFSDGSVLWRERAHGGVLQSINPFSIRGFPRDVSVSGGKVASGGSDGTVELRRFSDGGLVWRHAHHLDAVWEVSINGDYVYSSGRDGQVIAARLLDGHIVWRHDAHRTGSPRKQMVRSVYATELGVFSAGYDGRIFLSDLYSGEIIWSYQHPGRIKSVAYAEGLIVFSSWESDSDVVAVSIDDGSVVWTHNWHDRSASGFRGFHLGVEELVIHEGHVYSAGDDGRVVSASLHTGELVGFHNRHNSSVRSLAANSSGVVSIDRDGVVVFLPHEKFQGDSGEARVD